jgi:hypothetical protein
VPPLLSARSNIEEYFNSLKCDGVVLTREREHYLCVCGWGSWYTSVYFLSTSIVFSNLCGFYITQKGEDWQWYIAHCNNWSRGSVSIFFQFLVYILQKFENIKWRSLTRRSENGFLPAEYTKVEFWEVTIITLIVCNLSFKDTTLVGILTVSFILFLGLFNDALSTPAL